MSCCIGLTRYSRAKQTTAHTLRCETMSEIIIAALDVGVVVWNVHTGAQIHTFKRNVSAGHNSLTLVRPVANWTSIGE